MNEIGAFLSLLFFIIIFLQLGLGFGLNSLRSQALKLKVIFANKHLHLPLHDSRSKLIVVLGS